MKSNQSKTKAELIEEIKMLHKRVDELEQIEFKRKQLEKINNVIFQIAKAASTTQDLTELIEAIRIYLHEVIDTSNFYIGLYDESNDTIYEPYSRDEYDHFLSYPAGKTCTAYVIKTGKSLIIDDENAAQLEKTGEIEIFGTPSEVWLGVPLRVKDTVIGAVAVQSYVDANLYTKKDLEILEHVSNEIATVIERKQSEEAIINEKIRANNILEGTNAGTWNWNVQSGELIINERWAEIMGYTLKELEPIDYHTWKGNVHTDDLLIAQNRLEKHFAGKLDYYDVEFRQPHKNGDWVWVNARGKVVEWTEDGKPLQMSGTHLDITERKQLEDQLRHAQKLESITKLTGGIAHDFNNILGAIFGSVDMILLQLHNDHPSRRFANIILDKSQKAASLVKQMLAYSRQQQLNVVPMDINNVVQDLSLLLDRAVEERIELELDLAEDLKQINGDKTAIDQIVMNLCINATDAMQEGGKLTVLTENIENIAKYTKKNPDLKPGQYVRLTIADTGHGIAAENLDNIFEPFFTTRDVGEGTGLGLSMVFGLVSQHDGYIFCQSEVGKGTTFDVLIPVLDNLQSPTKKENDNEKLHHGGGTIMLVEDEKDLVEILGVILTELGYDIITASDGKEALHIYRDAGKQIDLVITDIIMPKMGGKELYEQIVKINPDVKFVFTSGYASRGFYKKYDIDPDMKILNKPFRLKDVSDIVKEMFNPK